MDSDLLFLKIYGPIEVQSSPLLLLQQSAIKSPTPILMSLREFVRTAEFLTIY